MGTDIHLVTQVRQPDGTWKNVKPVRKCWDCKGTGMCERSDGSTYECVWCQGKGDAWRYPNFHSRSYDTFSILADVRNGYGFAGVVTGEGFNPISAPRGLPTDLVYDERLPADDYDEEEQEDYTPGPDRPYVDGTWLGDHSFSWLTLAELLAYDWDQGTTKTGWLSKDEFARMKREGGHPKEWSGGVSGGMVRHVNQRDMTTLLDKPADGLSYYTQHTWAVTYRERAREFVENFIPALQQLGAPEDVRIVFGFDS